MCCQSIPKVKIHGQQDEGMYMKFKICLFVGLCVSNYGSAVNFVKFSFLLVADILRISYCIDMVEPLLTDHVTFSFGKYYLSVIEVYP